MRYAAIYGGTIVAKFIEAFEAMQAGKKVGRGKWDEGTRMYIYEGEELVMQTAKGDPMSWELHGEDLFATDWSIPDECKAA